MITDTSVAPIGVLESRLEALCRAARPGSILVQLRDLGLPTRVRLELGVRLRAITRAAGQWLAVNERADLAVLLEADALHLGEGGVASADARRIAPSIWVCRALHDPEQAAEIDADAVVLSPVIAARKGRPALGVEALQRCRSSARPQVQLFALGGISAQTAAECRNQGADGVAVIGAALGEGPVVPLLRALEISRV